MPTDDDKQPSEPKMPSAKAALFVFGTIVDTTWRIFVPVPLGVGLGIWADKSYGTLPWFTIAGTALGALVAGGLVYQQIKQGLKK